MTMLKSENLLDHDGRWVASDHGESFPSDPMSFDTCQEAIDYAKANPDKFLTRVGQVEVCTPERLVPACVVESVLENGVESFMDGWLGDTDPEDIASWTAEDVEAIRLAVLAVVRERGIVRSFYAATSITETGVPSAFDLADAAEGVA